MFHKKSYKTPKWKRKQVLFCNNDSKVEMVIKNFNNLNLYYDKYLGHKIIECKNCGDYIKQNINVQKYCGECARIIKKIMVNKYSKRYYHKNNFNKMNVSEI